jgi:hypothetical protein
MLATLTAGAVLAALAGPTSEPETFCPGYVAAERTWYDTEVALWPPGATECEFLTPQGTVVRTTHFDWVEWTVLALLTVSGALAVVVARRSASTRVVRAYTSGALLVIAAAALVLVGLWAVFLVPIVFVAVGVVMAGAARLS